MYPLFASCHLLFSVFYSPTPPTHSQPCGCDPRQRGPAGRLSSGRSQHYLPAAPRVRLHCQQAGRQVSTATLGAPPCLHATSCTCFRHILFFNTFKINYINSTSKSFFFFFIRTQFRPGDLGCHVGDLDVPATALPAADQNRLDAQQQLPGPGSGDHVQGGSPAAQV